MFKRHLNLPGNTQRLAVFFLEVSINGGSPIAGWFIREKPIKMDDDRGYPYFRKFHHFLVSLKMGYTMVLLFMEPNDHK